MKKIFLLSVCAALVGCKSPFDRTRDASNGGPTGTFGNAAAFVIFNNELKSGGGAFEFPGSEGQSLSFTDTSNPISIRSIRYNWTGQAVTNLGCPAQNPTHNFAGFDLMFKTTQDLYNAAPVGLDLRQANYTKVTFFARGSLSSNTSIKVEVATAGSSNACFAASAPCTTLSASGTVDDCLTDSFGGPNLYHTPPHMLTASWQQYSIQVPNSQLANVRDFFKSTFVFVDPFVGNLAPGQGGTVYYDKIQYEQ